MAATSEVDAALRDIDATLLADEYDSTGRRVTAVDALITETIARDLGVELKFARADGAAGAAWEAVARDLARQVINAEAEIAELDAVIEATEEEADDFRFHEEQQAHCDTYIEAVRLSAELAGWQNSSHAEYRRSTAAARLEQYSKSSVGDDVGAGF